MLQPRNNVQRQLYCSKCFTADVKADYLGMAMFWALFVCVFVFISQVQKYWEILVYGFINTRERQKGKKQPHICDSLVGLL